LEFDDVVIFECGLLMSGWHSYRAMDYDVEMETNAA
jgi:hypothetical protein